jgi:CHAT domain-containing protein
MNPFSLHLKLKEFFVLTHNRLFHFIIGMSLLSCLLSFDRPLGVFSSAQSKDEDAIRSLVVKLFEAYQQEDIDSLISYWSKKSDLLEENKKALQKEFDDYDKIIVKGFDIRQLKINSDKATLRVVAEMALTRSKMVQAAERIEKKNRTIELVDEGGTWKIWKFMVSEEILAAAILAAKTEKEQKNLMEAQPELVTSDFAAALIRQIYVSVDRENYKRALAINELAYKLAEQFNNQWAMANAWINSAFIYGGWLDIPEKSHVLGLEYYRKSLKLGEEFGFKDVVAKSLLQSAVIYQQLGELSLAAEYNQKSLTLLEEVGSHDGTVRALNNLGVIYHIQGDYAKSLQMALKCLKMTESQLNSGADWARLSRALGLIGSIFFDQGNYEQSLVYTQRSVDAAERGIMLGDVSAKAVKVTILGTIGDIYLQKGNHSLAMECYQNSLKLAEELENTLAAYEGDTICWIKIHIGNALAAENKTLQAIAIYEETLQLAEILKNKANMVYPLSHLAKTHLLRGDYRKALGFAERAAEVAGQTGQYPYIYSALVTAANAYRMLGQPVDARQVLDRAINLTEQFLEQFAGGEVDRQRAFEGAVTPYLALIDLQVDQKQFKEAFASAQRAKGRILLDLMQNGRVNIVKSASSAEREREQQLSQKLVSLNRQIASEKLKPKFDEKRLSKFDEDLKKARLEFEAFQTTLYAAHPELKVQRGEIRPVSVDDAVGLIPDSKNALLDFIVSDENVQLFVLTKNGSAQPTLNSYTIKIERKALAEKVERFRRRMENRDYDFQALSQELYGLLIKPAQKQLRNKTNLIISPDNVLWDLPFQVLLSPELRYLIEDAAISYAPSLSVLREMRIASKKDPAPTRASLLALGNPALGQRSRELVKFVKMDAELQPLPEAADQVRALERLYGKTLSQVYTGTAAREELVKEQSSRYRILHLATHGILNDTSPMYSHVMLSQTPAKDDEDGLLEAWEMMNLDLNADLVVLSACETARGRVGAGEGVIGMTWALFVAGCPRTVVSQWKVEASSTTALMVEFHKKFKTRYGGRQPAVSTAEAMRQAALKVMKNPEYAHPFYWGGFVVVGDGN